MGQPLEVVASDLHSAAARLQEAGQRLQDGLSGVDLETRELLGSGWRGEAASAFSSVWEQWHSGAGQVVRALQSMSELLTVAGKEYSKIDEQAAGAVSSSFPDAGRSGGTATGNGPGAQHSRQAFSNQSEGDDPMAQRVASLAQQMMPLGSQTIQPLAQAGQVAAGLAQVAAQVAQVAAQAAQVAEQATQGDESAQTSDAASAGDQSTPTAPVHNTPAEPPTQSSPSSLGAVDRSRGSKR